MAIFNQIGSKTARLIATQLDDVAQKISICNDTKVKSVAEELINTISGNVTKKSQKVINKAEHLLDTVNTANSQYCTLFNEWMPLNCNKKPPFIYRLFPKKLQRFAMESRFSAPRITRNLSERSEFSNIEKFNSLKRFISKYSEDKEMVDYLYNQYYLKNIDDIDFRNYLNKISNEFNVKLFTDKPLKKSSQLYIYEELKNFQKASKGKIKFPPLIDITEFDPMVVRAGAKGICVDKRRAATQFGMRITTDENYMLKAQGLRHELIHWVDEKLSKCIFKQGHIKIDPADFAEMRKAKVKNIYYAANNSDDFKAVWGQGSMSKYSDELKQKMVKNGLPEWITNLEDVSLIKYLDEIFKDKNSQQTLNEMRKDLKNNFTEEITYKLIDNPEKLAKYSEILKYKRKDGRPIFMHALDYWDLPQEKLAYAEKFAKLSINVPATEDMIAQGLTKDYYPQYLDDLAYRIKDFSTDELEKIYRRAQKCQTENDYEKLNLLLDRYIKFKTNAKIKKSTKELLNCTTIKKMVNFEA